MFQRTASTEIKNKIRRLVDIQVDLSNSVCNRCGGHNGFKLSPFHHCGDGEEGRLIGLDYQALLNSYQNGKCDWLDSWEEEPVFEAIKHLEYEITIEKRRFNPRLNPLRYSATSEIHISEEQ